MAEDWIQMRVRRATHERLAAFIGGLILAYDNGQIDAVNRHDRLFTVDDAIRVLLDRNDRKKERARKSRAKQHDSEDLGLGHNPAPGG